MEPVMLGGDRPGRVRTGVAGMSGREGTRDADFSSWMQARQGQLLRTAYLLTGDRHSAEDLVQTSLAKLYLAWDRVEDHGHVDAYARRILVNEHRSGWRRPWKRREVVREELPEQAHNDQLYDGRSEALWAFVGTLPRRQRAVVVLRYYEQLSEAATADALDISVGTVKSQCSRALAKLRRDLAEHPQISRGEEER